MPSTVIKAKSAEQALASLERLCAKAERSSGDALRLMRRWGVSDADRAKVLKRLQADRFIDDRRYAAAFARDKVRFSGWGTLKIRAALRAKGIAAATIDEAMGEVTKVDNAARLADMLRRKAATVKAKDTYDLRAKLIRFGLSRGFTYDEVFEAVEQFNG